MVIPWVWYYHIVIKICTEFLTRGRGGGLIFLYMIIFLHNFSLSSNILPYSLYQCLSLFYLSVFFVVVFLSDQNFIHSNLP